MPKLLEELRQKRTEIYKIANKYGVSNIRVFGSVARGKEKKNSDVDLLIKVTNYKKYCQAGWGRSLFQEEVEKILHHKTDVVTEKSLHRLLKNEIIATAKAL
jgi:predicted nucleotidyltransferase